LAEAPSPTIRRRELGTRLRELRQEAGMSVEDVAHRLMISPAKVSRLETAARGVVLRDVRDLCDLYGVGDIERTSLMELARDSKQQAWWQEYELPYSTYIGLEAAAFAISDYDSCVVPGLLQTPEYARAIIQGTRIDSDPSLVKARVEVRLRRQDLLTKEQPPRLSLIFDEAVLRRIVGSQEVMRSQVESLIERSSLPNVTLQVIPFVAGAHPGMNSTFTLLHFHEAAPDVVYIEGLVGNLYLERPKDLARYIKAWNSLSAKALSPSDSTAYLSMVARQLTT
jgi:transcriptional regulator with XRE-family HTH domain